MNNQQEDMEYIWRAGDHKLHRIIPFDGDAPDIRFVYNPLGQRIMKLVRPRTNGVTSPENEWTATIYGLDANGQLMATYSNEYTETTAEIFVDERYIYGTKRIGVMKRGVKIFENGTLSPSSDPIKTNALGLKRYSLKSYNGTVNVSISDRKTWNSTDGIFEATIMHYSEFYAYGSLLPNRSYNADESRFLFHNMETDMEVSGTGNSYTTEFRQYDPRLGRWKSLDALMFMFPHLSPYVGFDNNPIYYVDPYGLSSEKGEDGGDPNRNEGDKIYDQGSTEEVNIAAQRTSEQSPEEAKMDRAMGKGKWSEGGEFSDDYGSENWLQFMKNNNWSNSSSQESKDRDGQKARSQYYERKGITLPGTVTTEDYPGQWRDDFNREISERNEISAPYAGYMFLTFGVIYSGAAAIEMIPFMAPYVVPSLRMYHTTIGMNGGYANMGLNWINQSYIQGGGSNYLSFEGKSITGLIMSGSFRYNSTLGGQMMVGAADPWINLSFSGNGFTSAGYFLNSSGNKPSPQQTTALSIMGTFNSIYMGSPLLKSGLGNTLIGNGLMAPGQKAVTNVKE
jgi:RHS repeat-associated protein